MDIGRICDVSDEAVRFWLHRYNIFVRNRIESEANRRGERKYIDGDWLYKHYIDDNLSFDDIAEICGVCKSTIKHWLYKLEIKKTKLYKDRGWLYQKYVEEGHSMLRIANICNVDSSTIKCWLREYNISMRSMSENQMGKRNPYWIDGRSSDPQYKRRGYLKRLGLPDEFIEQALNQKKKRTDIELMMEYWLINNRVSYEFQKYIKLPSTRTWTDFFIEPNICLYCDGDRFHKSEKVIKRDKRITKELRSLDYRVIRIWGSDICEGVRPWGIFGLLQSKYEQQSLLLMEKSDFSLFSNFFKGD